MDVYPKYIHMNPEFSQYKYYFVIAHKRIYILTFFINIFSVIHKSLVIYSIKIVFNYFSIYGEEIYAKYNTFNLFFQVICIKL